MEATTSEKMFLDTIQDVALNTKQHFDKKKRSIDDFIIGDVRFINFELSEWTNDVNSKIIQLLVDRANDKKQPLVFLQDLKSVFEREIDVIIEGGKIGSYEFGRNEQYLFGVKFYPEFAGEATEFDQYMHRFIMNINTPSNFKHGENQSKKFAKCIDQAIDQLQAESAKGKFNSFLTDEGLIAIHKLLTKTKKMLHEDTDIDLWLYWFNRKPNGNTSPMKWEGTPSMLTNIIQKICKEAKASTIKNAFGVEKVSATATEFEKTKMGKKIIREITIDKQRK